MKAPREEEEGGIIAQGAHVVNGILSRQAADVLSASISRHCAIKEAIQNNQLRKEMIADLAEFHSSTETKFSGRNPSASWEVDFMILYGRG